METTGGVIEIMVVGLLLVSGFFFLAGTLAVIRFPDVFTRLHGLTKADNLGLGLLVLALALHAGDAAVAAKLIIVWLAAMTFGSLACHLIARREDRGADGGSDDA